MGTTYRNSVVKRRNAPPQWTCAAEKRNGEAQRNDTAERAKWNGAPERRNGPTQRKVESERHSVTA